MITEMGGARFAHDRNFGREKSPGSHELKDNVQIGADDGIRTLISPGASVEVASWRMTQVAIGCQNTIIAAHSRRFLVIDSEHVRGGRKVRHPP